MRIQILELPSESVGEVNETPWIAIISEPGGDVVGWSTQLKAAGASAVLFTNNVVEIGPPPSVHVIEGQLVGPKPNENGTIQPEYWRDSNLVELVAKARYDVALHERVYMNTEWDQQISQIKDDWRMGARQALGKSEEN